MTKKRKLALVATASLALLTVLGILLLQTQTAIQYGFGRARDYLRQKYDLDLTAGDIRLDLLHFSLTARGVLLRANQVPDLPPLLRAELVRVRLAPIASIRNLITVRDAEIVRPEINIFTDRNGRKNFPQVSQPAGERSKFVIEGLRAVAGSLRFEDQVRNVTLALPIWRLQVSGNPITLEHRLRLSAEATGNAGYNARGLPLDGFDVQGKFGGDRFDIEAFQARSVGSSIRASGSIRQFGQPRFDLKIMTDIDLGEAALFAGYKESISGRLSGMAAIAGTTDMFEVEGQVNGNIAALRGYTDITFGGSPRYLSSTRELQLPAFTVRSAQGGIEGTATLFVQQGTGTSTLDAELRSLALEPLARLLDAPLVPAARASGHIKASWPAMHYQRASGESRVRLDSDRPQPAKNVLPIAGAVSATFDANRIQITLRPVRTLATELAGKVILLSRQKLEGRVRASVSDIHAAMAESAMLLGRNLVQEQLGGSAIVDAELGGTLSSPSAVFALDSPELQVGQLHDIHLKANGSIDETTLKVHDLRADFRNQTMTANAIVGLEGDNPPVELHARMDRASLPSILSVFDISIPSAGTLQATADIQGHIKDLRGNITLNGSDLSLYNQPFGTLTAAARIVGDRIETTQFLVQKNPADPASDSITGSGNLDMNSKHFSFSADGREVVLDRLMLPHNLPAKGVINLNARGSGTLSDPFVSMNVAGRDIQVQDHTIGAATLVAQVRGSEAVVSTDIPELKFTSTAHIATRFPYAAALEAQVKNSNPLAALFAAPQLKDTKGTVDATLSASGNLAQWRQGTARLLIRDLRVTAEKHEIRNEGPVEIRYSQGLIQVPSAAFVSGNSSLLASGNLAVHDEIPRGQLNLNAALDLAELQPFVGAAVEGLVTSGRLDANLMLTGTLKRLSVNGTAAVTNGFVEYPPAGTPFTNISLALDVRNCLVHVETAQAQWAGAAIRLTGTVPLALVPYLPVEFEHGAAEPARFALELSNLDLASTGRLPEGLSGNVDLRISGEAPHPDVRDITAQAVFNRLQFRVQDYTLEQAAATTIALRNGVARIERMTLTGPTSKIEAYGTAGLLGNQPLDLHVTGTIDAAILGLLSDQIRAAGPLQTRFDVVGTLKAPDLSGTLALDNGQLSMKNPRVAASNLDLRLAVRRNMVTVEQLTGSLNGGYVRATGSFAYASGALRAFDVNARIRNGFFEFPEGLKTVADGNLTIRSHDPFIDIAGEIKVSEGSYRRPVETNYLLTALRSEPAIELVPKRSPFLDRIRYDVTIESTSPIVVDNNVAKLAANANLNLVGTYYQPSIIGRIDAEEGGEIYLNERRYFLDSAVIEFLNAYRIEPELDVRARAQVSNYEITMQVTGPPENLDTVLTADDPSLSQSDIMSLLLTGRVEKELAGKELDVAKQQVLSVLAGSASQHISQELESTLGLTTVRIDPSLISAEADPGARLTVGEDLAGKRLRLIYSMDLVNSSNQIWIVESDVTKRFLLRGTKQEDRPVGSAETDISSYRFELQHDLRLGGSPSSASPRRDNRLKREIGRVRFSGEPLFTNEILESKLKVSSGKKYDFFNVQNGVDRLQKFYLDRGYLESRISVDRRRADHTVDLTFDVKAGPRVTFTFSGTQIPDKVREKVSETWSSGVFDTERADDAVQVIREWLFRQGYLESRVDYRIDSSSSGEKRVSFQITPGAHFKHVELVFSGASVIKPDDLKSTLEKADLVNAIYNNPQEVIDFLTRFYNQNGYLQAEVSRPKLHLDARTGTGNVEIPIAEGPQFKTGSLSFSGNRAFNDETLRRMAALPGGSVYHPNLINNALDRLQDFYRTAGYTDAAITYQLVQNAPASQTDLMFRIEENQRSVITELEVQGNDRTSAAFILRQLTIRRGDVLDPHKLSSSRKNLYDAGVYTVVDFDTEPVAQAAPPPDPDIKPVRVTVKVREVQPYRIQYGAFYDTDRGPGFRIDASNRNFLKAAAVLGVSGRYDGTLKQIRPYFSQPSVRGIPLKTDATAFLQRETHAATTTQGGFNIDRIGVSVFQQKRFRDKFVLDYGYKYERTHTYDLIPDPLIPFDITVPIARLTGTLSRDTRDDILDATRGSFTSQAFEFAPKMLGSDVQFWRYYGQYFKYLPLRKPSETTGKLQRPRFVYAGAVRLGLGNGLGGQDLFPSERFFAGGGTTMRGFRQDLLGPIDVLGKPEGGEALFILNNEIRAPLFSVFDGVGFVDLGNVYPKLSDFKPTDVRKAAGIGLRLHTGYVVLRLDYGFKLDRKPGESRGALFFSIGQAF